MGLNSLLSILFLVKKTISMFVIVSTHEELYSSKVCFKS
jgi:hypothetical protein